MEIKIATLDNINQIAPLFNGYRMFYKQENNLDAARSFLNNRLTKKDSHIFFAEDSNGEALGFTQLYPSFSSVSMQRTFILNDLFVSNNVRSQGVGKALLKFAQAFAIKQNAKGLTLETEITNPAQHLYEHLGWKKDTEVLHYTWKI